jgi:hypothetical protein
VPAVVASARLAPVATSGGPGGLGNLAAPVPAWSSVGPWLTGDYRFPLDDGGAPGPTYVLIAIAIALAVLGFVSAVRRRDLGVLALAVAGVVAMAYVVRASAEWSDFKAYVISAPAILTTALVGAAWLARMRPRALGAVGLAAGVAVAGGVLAGNALVYHGTSLAPYGRFADLQEINDRYAGQGPSLYPVFDEYAEYILRDVQASGLVNPADFNPGLGETANEGLQFVRDPDEYSQEYLATRKLLIIRRDPTLSRPPGDFRLVERTPHHEVWRHERGPRIVAHIPVQTGKQPTAGACADLRDAVRKAGAGARVRYVGAPPLVQFGADETGAPRSWDYFPPDFVAHGPGAIRGATELPEGGDWSIWLRGSFGREVRVLVDGEVVGSARWKESYPGYYVHLDDRRLSAGEHRVEIVRGGGSPLPGTANEVGTGNTIALVGPAAFLAERPQEIRTVSPQEGLAVCRGDQPVDWLEVIAG